MEKYKFSKMISYSPILGREISEKWFFWQKWDIFDHRAPRFWASCFDGRSFLKHPASKVWGGEGLVFVRPQTFGMQNPRCWVYIRLRLVPRQPVRLRSPASPESWVNNHVRNHHIHKKSLLDHFFKNHIFTGAPWIITKSRIHHIHRAPFDIHRSPCVITRDHARVYCVKWFTKGP